MTGFGTNRCALRSGICSVKKCLFRDNFFFENFSVWVKDKFIPIAKLYILIYELFVLFLAILLPKHPVFVCTY